MVHIMKLTPSPFNMICSGVKTIELRLYDSKRQKLKVGDKIVFINTDEPLKKIEVKVVDLYIFDSFKTLYNELPLSDCGYTKEDIDTASPDDMDKYYTKEEQEKYGVIGIKIALQG